jgi:EPS-associated MarR family transcriptional regulator
MQNDDISRADAVRFSVMRLVHENPHITQRELAGRLGLSLGRVNYCIGALVEKGLVKVENFRSSSAKWQYMYVLTPSGIAARAGFASRFLARKIREFEQLKAEIAALQDEALEVETDRNLSELS